MRYAIEIAKELNWTSRQAFATGLRKTVKWYLVNQNWCQHVQDGRYYRESIVTSLRYWMEIVCLKFDKSK